MDSSDMTQPMEKRKRKAKPPAQLGESATILVLPLTKKKKKNDGAAAATATATSTASTIKVPPQESLPAKLMQKVLFLAASRAGIGEPEFVLTKRLFESDVDKGQHRLQLTEKAIMESPLRRTITEKIGDHWDKPEVKKNMSFCLRAWVFDERLERRYDMDFKLLASNHLYRFTDEWIKFVAEKGLRSGRTVELWKLDLGQILRAPATASELSSGRAPDIALAMCHYDYDENDDDDRSVRTEAEGVVVEAMLALNPETSPFI